MRPKYLVADYITFNVNSTDEGLNRKGVHPQGQKNDRFEYTSKAGTWAVDRRKKHRKCAKLP